MAVVMAQVTEQYRQGVAAAMVAVRALVMAMVAVVELVTAQCRLVEALLGVATPVSWAR
jgi:hypothetical protein